MDIFLASLPPSHFTRKRYFDIQSVRYIKLYKIKKNIWINTINLYYSMLPFFPCKFKSKYRCEIYIKNNVKIALEIIRKKHTIRLDEILNLPKNILYGFIAKIMKNNRNLVDYFGIVFHSFKMKDVCLLKLAKNYLSVFPNAVYHNFRDGHDIYLPFYKCIHQYMKGKYTDFYLDKLKCSGNYQLRKTLL